jgi:hypothetical protein
MPDLISAEASARCPPFPQRKFLAKALTAATALRPAFGLGETSGGEVFCRLVFGSAGLGKFFEQLFFRRVGGSGRVSEEPRDFPGAKYTKALTLDRRAGTIEQIWW